MDKIPFTSPGLENIKSELNNLKKECLKEFEKNYCNNFFDEAEKK